MSRYRDLQLAFRGIKKIKCKKKYRYIYKCSKGEQDNEQGKKLQRKMQKGITKHN